MKRKIAAILAADVVGYSRLIAEDEEEALRRLASYRAVIDDFIAKANGRIFNTAGDAVLAEFSSAVEAVRCAIDVQESLRTRNMAYPPSRQMSFRIGITIGDVVERDGDLLGDGVNIAARLEGLAAPGGICISRTVFEQVANKLSVQFADIGAQEVKNIPNPVHAYMVALRAEDALADASLRRKQKRNWLWPSLAFAALVVVAAGVGGFVYFSKMNAKTPAIAVAAVPAPQAVPAQPATQAKTAPLPAAPVTAPSPAQKSAAIPLQTADEVLSPGAIPFIPDGLRAQVRDEYMLAADHKALAITTGRFIGYVTGQPSEDLARTAALEACQRRVESAKVAARCDLYAVGNKVVFARARPPMPQAPYVIRDSLVERPFSTADVPLINDAGRTNIERNYVPARKPKAVAISATGGFTFYTGQDSADEAVRRALELCGNNAGTPCMIVALDDAFVVPIPKTMKVRGVFRPATSSMVAASERDQLARRMAGVTRGWSAVAASINGRTGVSFNADNEEAAMKSALADCAKIDRDCRIIAIGPFAVEPL